MPKFSFDGFCPICQEKKTFACDGEWFRDLLLCPSCQSTVRERALALIMEETLPGWRELAIHECSPSDRGISAKLRREAEGYIGSHFFHDVPRGESKHGLRSEDLENQTFGDECFDCVVTLDVMEHLFNPARAYQEIWRTLRPGGVYLHTFPIQKGMATGFDVRASLGPDGEIIHHAEPQYHGNPVDPSGALVTFDYGYDVSKQIAEWAPFDVRVTRFSDQTHGILGEYTEVIACRKRRPS